MAENIPKNERTHHTYSKKARDQILTRLYT